MSGSPPVITSISTDKASYAKGALVTVTISYQPGSSDETVVLTGTATDKTTGLSGQLTVSFVVAGTIVDQCSASVADSGNRTWAKVSDTGGVAVFTALA